MANEKRLIDANAFIKELDSFIVNPPFAHPATPWHRGITLAAKTALLMPTVDAVEVDAIKSWLYQIAMNNVGVPVRDFSTACEEIISRLDGLRTFATERREDNDRQRKTD